MSTKLKTLLAVEPYRITANQLGELKKNTNSRPYYEKNLPEYCFRKDNNLVNESNSYLQFVYNGDETYIVFDIKTADKLLQEEINEGGFEGKYGLLRYGHDNYNEKALFHIITNHFKIDSFKNYNWSYPVAQYIVVELEYFGGTYEYPYDTDLNIIIMGHLNDNLQFIKYKENEK